MIRLRLISDLIGWTKRQLRWLPTTSLDAHALFTNGQIFHKKDEIAVVIKLIRFMP
jgi:hypothetical protein